MTSSLLQRLNPLRRGREENHTESPSETAEPALDACPRGLRVVVDGVKPVVDIVAVPGLYAHRDKTWTAWNGVQWFRDLLSSDIPNVRILCWGYDGNSRVSSQYFYDDHARSLVSDLCLERELTNTTTRPIIFVAHSLGGIIVKSALIHSDEARQGALEHHRSIRLSTYGIIFMGTPHQGVQLGGLIANIASVVTGIDNPVVKRLQQDSEWFQQQHSRYMPISRDFVTICAYERRVTRTVLGQSIMVVPRASAVALTEADEKLISIDADHYSMVKFSSKENPWYRAVLGHLRIMAQNASEVIGARWEMEIRVNADKSTFDNDDVASFKDSAYGTMSETSSVQALTNLPGVREEMLDILINDSSLEQLGQEALKKFDADIFVRDFTKMLQDFAHELRQEAQQKDQRGAAYIFRCYAAYAAKSACNHWGDVEDSGMAEMLARLPEKKIELDYALQQRVPRVGPEDTLGDNDGITDEWEESDAEGLRYLKPLEDFVTGSRAFQNLRKKIQEWAIRQAPDEKLNKAPENPHTSSKWFWRYFYSTLLWASMSVAEWLGLYEKSLAPGHQRLKWSCACGETFYKDFQDPKHVRDLLKTLQTSGYKAWIYQDEEQNTARKGGPSKAHRSDGGIGENETGSSDKIRSSIDQPGCEPSYANGNDVEDARHTSDQAETRTDTDTTGHPQEAGPGTETAGNPQQAGPGTETPGHPQEAGTGTETAEQGQKWLLLCFNVYRHSRKAEHVEIRSELNDFGLFRQLREKYVEERGVIFSYFAWKGVTKISFVQFQLWFDSRTKINTPLIDLESWAPPEGWENGGRWRPCPQQAKRPKLDDQFLLHLFYHPHNAMSYKINDAIMTCYRSIRRAATRTSRQDDSEAQNGSNILAGPKVVYGVTPKRLIEELVADEEKPPYGWGIYLEEGFLLPRAIQYSASVLLTGLIIGLMIYCITRVKQEGFAVFGTWSGTISAASLAFAIITKAAGK